MANETTVPQDRIQKTVAIIVKRHPFYSPLLTFYGLVFSAQEDSEAELRLEPVHIPDNVLAIRRREKFPLITLSEFAIDADRSADLLSRLCDLSREANDELRQSGETIDKALLTGKLLPEELFSNFLKEDNEAIDRLAVDLKIDSRKLRFFAYHSIRPSLRRCAAHLTEYLDASRLWLENCCPICGSPPGLSMIRESNNRDLVCSMCGHAWTVPRIFCPFCGIRDSNELSYFYSDEEPEYRVDVCNGCQTYIKTVDTRRANRWIYPPLEQVATLHLDLKAKDEGFTARVSKALEW